MTAWDSATNFPTSRSSTQVNIVEELTEFAIAEPATAWWIPGGEWNRYEYLYNRTPLTEVSQAHTPMTMKLASGVHLAIHEAALVDYAGMWLRRVTGQRLKSQLSPSSSGPEGRAPRTLRHALAHAADRRRCTGPVHVASNPQSERA